MTKRSERVKAVFRGIKDGVRDELLTWEDAASVLDDGAVAALESIVAEAAEKRKTIPPEKRRPWKTLSKSSLRPLRVKAAHPAKVKGGSDGPR